MVKIHNTAKSIVIVKLSIFIALLLASFPLFAGGESEGAATATHGKYLAGQGIIIPSRDVHINGYIAQLNYNYAIPQDKDFAVYPNLGNSQISSQGQREYIHIGIMARKVSFDQLPPLNLAFVIDNSGSMAGENKLDWVKESFYIFIDKVRAQDYVSLVVFNSDSTVLFPSTKMDSQENRNRFIQAVSSIVSGGGTNLRDGLKDGYSQVLANYREEYNNRVLFLTDGEGPKEGIIEMAETYLAHGINVSTIGVGSNFDVNLMTDLARAGGGSSRFINDREEMAETFGDELDRMIMPASSNMKITLNFPEYVVPKNTWGYNNKILSDSIEYYLPTLHNGDYETILAEIEILPNEQRGTTPVATIHIEYEDLDGAAHVMEPLVVSASFLEQTPPVYGVSDYTVLQSSTMKYIGEQFIKIADLYYGSDFQITKLNDLRIEEFNRMTDLDGLSPEEQEVRFLEITSPLITELENEILENMETALAITRSTISEVENVKLKLDNIGFEAELTILNHYVDILGKELNFTEHQLEEAKIPREILPADSPLEFHDYVVSLFQELQLSVGTQDSRTLGISPFVQKSDDDVISTVFTEYLNQTAENAFAKEYTLVDRTRLEDILEEQQLGLSGLIDTEKSIAIGKLLAADYFITGNVIPTNSSVIVFARILDVETSEVKAVAQVFIPLTSELRGMLEI